MRSKIFFLVLATAMIPSLLPAQLNHFIYLQTEGKQPFYAKLDKKIFSSSASGYLIIPKLKDGTYNITIGFPKAENSEQTYSCTVNNKDAGYLIKNFGDKGWGLFNLQTLETVMAAPPKTDVAKKETTEKTDEFSNMLSEAVNDPSIKQVEKKARQPEEIKENATISKPANEPVVKPAGRSGIVKKEVITTAAGVEMLYIDITSDKQDTIHILIPAEKTDDPVNVVEPARGKDNEIKVQGQKPEEKETGSVKPIENTNTGKEKVNEAAGTENKKFLPIEVKGGEKADSTAPVNAVAMINSNCKGYASEEDFLKLRKKMAAEDKDDAMIAVAQKFLKAKCYTTDQVKNLSVLFLKDEGKYRFFDLAYQFVSDSNNYSILELQLSDSYYISRFKAMVRH